MTRKIFTQEVKDYIYGEIDRRGSITVDEVALIIKKLGVYDPLATEEQWYRDKARRLMAQRKDSGGVRVLYAPRTARATYINIETCDDPILVNAVLRQLIDKQEGLNAPIMKARRRAAELLGQTSLYQPKAPREAFDFDAVARL